MSCRSLFAAVVVAVLSSSILVAAYSGSSLAYGGGYGMPMTYGGDYGSSNWYRGTGRNDYRRPQSYGWQMNPYSNNRYDYGYNQGTNGYNDRDYYGYGNNRDYYGYGQG
eukprot:12979523-Ditylum_brightwellii.AAC.1